MYIYIYIYIHAVALILTHLLEKVKLVLTGESKVGESFLLPLAVKCLPIKENQIFVCA